MEGNYPIIINGQVCGSLAVSREGAYTRFCADCEAQGGVIRLSVYGEGREGYLGVPLPREGRLWLDKKFSPSAVKAFPAVIDRCGLAGEEAEAAKDDEPVCEQEPMPEEENCEMPESEEKPEEGPFWYAATDGALVSRDGEVEMVALPPEDERVPRGFPGQPRIIEGKEYLVYITKEM